jgi:integrase/recombinase XerD
VKAGATVRTEDLAGLRNLASHLGDKFVAGYVLYTGQQTLPFGGKIKAVLSTIAGFYRYAVEEELLDHSPATHVRRPRLDYESHATALDRNELRALLVAAGLGPPPEHALISLLTLNGLRVSESTGADIEHLGLERGHRTLTITRRAARSSPSRSRPALPGRSDPGHGRTLRRPGLPHRRRAAAGPARRRTDCPPGRPAGRDQQERRAAHAAARAVTAALDAGVPLRDVQEAASTLTREPP